MGASTYLARRGARYHFRRRLASVYKCSRPISISLGTADPVEARRLVRRLAAKWDEIHGMLIERITRGTLALAESEKLFRKAMEDELAHATRHRTAPIGAGHGHPATHKILAAAYRVVALVPHDADQIAPGVIEQVIDASWSAEDRQLLQTTLRVMITPMSVSRTNAVEALEEFGTNWSETAIREARSHLLRGCAEAHERSAMFDDPLVTASGRGVSALLDDALIGQIRSGLHQCATAETRPATESSTSDRSPNSIYANPSGIRFSEIIENTLAKLKSEKKWKSGDQQRKAIAERFAWVTGDKPLADYHEGHIQDFIDALRRIPNNVRCGELGVSGLMAAPYDPDTLPKVTDETMRDDRSINRDLSLMQAMSKHLAKSHWRLKYGKDIEMNFSSYTIRIEENPKDPRRMPWTPQHLEVMYGLPLWQGGGGAVNRLKPSDEPAIYQDAAYWVPLLGSYTGMAREETCGLEVEDFDFECEIPFLRVRENMTRSKDGKTPGGLKRLSRYRIMPIHSQLLRLGLQEYVEAVAKDQGYEPGQAVPIFPELYLAEAKTRSDGKLAPEIGGKRFYARSWVYIVDATHALMPLPETRRGKKSDFHSQRTYTQSVLASPQISQTIIDRQMGHKSKGTGPNSYNRRALALGEVEELSERLKVLESEMPNVTAHVPRASRVKLLPLNRRSRVGSAPGRDAQKRFCQ